MRRRTAARSRAAGPGRPARPRRARSDRRRGSARPAPARRRGRRRSRRRAVVPGEQQVQREDHDGVEEDPDDHLEHDRAALGRRAWRCAGQPAAAGRAATARRPARRRSPGPGRSTPPVRRRRKTRQATPVAATTSTEISPMVSQARMSTRVTLTMFLPPPKSTACLGEVGRDGRGRAGGERHGADRGHDAPTATAMTPRTARSRGRWRSVKSSGSRRSTSTKTTRVTVSTRNWVSARSGAPCSTNSTAMP